MTVRHFFVTAALLAVVALTGCASDAPEPGASPTEAPTTPPSPIPESSPEATAPPDPGELVLRPDGLGTLVVGESAPAPSDPTAMIEFIDDFCVSEDFGVAPGDPGAGAWVAVPIYDYDRGGEGGSLFWVGVDDAGLIQGVEVFGIPDIPTEAGIRVGSTVAELLAAYPDLTGPGGDSGLSQYYLVDGPGGRLVIEVAVDDSPGYWPPEFVDTVLGMTAVPSGTPGFTIAGSDGGLGGCPL